LLSVSLPRLWHLLVRGFAYQWWHRLGDGPIPAGGYDKRYREDLGGVIHQKAIYGPKTDVWANIAFLGFLRKWRA